DLLPFIDRFDRQPFHVQRTAEHLRRLAGSALEGSAVRPWSEHEFRRALFAAYADRLAKRRAPASERLTLASGHGASMGRESGVREGEYLVALDVTAAT